MESSDSISGLNFEIICRTCLQTKEEMVEISQTIADTLMAFTELKVHFEDRLPRRVCPECVQKILNAYNFKIEAENNEKILLSYLKTKYEVTEDEEIPVYQPDDFPQIKEEPEDSENFEEIIECDPGQVIDAENYAEDEDDEGNDNNDNVVEGNNSNITIPEKEHSSFESIFTPNYMNFPTSSLSKQKQIECKICNINFDKISTLRNHMNTHTSLESFTNINFEKNQIVSIFNPSGFTDYQKFTEFIIAQVKQGKALKFCSIVNSFGDEMRLSDSETEDDDNDDSINNAVGNDIPKDQKISSFYKCDLCNEEFDRKYKIFQHQTVQHLGQEMPHICEYCNATFVSKSILDYHLKTQCQNFEASFQCGKCKKRFIWKKNLEEHQEIQHFNPKSLKKSGHKKNYICCICQKVFNRQDKLRRHSKIHEPDDKKFECHVCQRKFSRKDHLKAHLRTHERSTKPKDALDNDLKFLCVYCGKKFSSNSNMVVHMRRHTGDKPYKCDVCDKGFPRSFDLNCHKRTHTGEKPCLCTVCGKSFSRSNKLARHMRIHTGDRPYKCIYCDRAFTQSNDLTLHIRRHTGEKPYVCGVCNARFIQGTALHAHCRLKGHYADNIKHEIPESNLSVNNPNRLTIVDRIEKELQQIANENRSQ